MNLGVPTAVAIPLFVSPLWSGIGVSVPHYRSGVDGIIPTSVAELTTLDFIHMCLFPIRLPIRTKYGVYKTDVPCGHCLICLQNQQNQWTTRLYFEIKNSSSTHFITLTYNDSNIPTAVTSDGEVVTTLKPKDVQDWLKRFRQHYKRNHGKDSKLKYFLCGEYGSRRKRPHYHLLLFNLSNEDLNYLQQDWNARFGFTYLEKVNYDAKSLYNVSAYVSKYSTKGIFQDETTKKLRIFNPDYDKTNFHRSNCRKYIYVNQARHPEFRRVSNGIGISYVNEQTKSYHLCSNINVDNSDEQSKYIIERKKIQIPLNNGKTFSANLPRYYSKKIFGEANLLTDSLFRSVLQKSSDLHSEQLAQLPQSLSLSEKNHLLHTIENNKKRIYTKNIADKTRKFLQRSKF